MQTELVKEFIEKQEEPEDPMFKKVGTGQAVVVHAFNPRTREVEAGGSL